MVRDIMAAVSERVVVCEGAMGTMLAAGGVRLRSSAEANLTHPENVAGIHRLYRQAGAELFQTNTFAAHPAMLARAGLLPRAGDIWAAAVRLCREAAGPEGFVAANLGPTGHLLAPLGDLDPEEARLGFRRQLEGMLGRDVDLVLIESFEAIEEAETAIEAVRELDTDIPVAVTLTFSSPAGRTSMGLDGATATQGLQPLNVQIIGASCGTPEGLEAGLREMAQLADRPLMAQANAGVPELRDGETLFASRPVEMGQQAARLIGYGARIIGGCCGSTPDHIAQIARAASAQA